MKYKVLYICSHKDLGGASQSMLDMVESLSSIIEPIILTTAKGELSKECEKRGYRCLITPFSDLASLYISFRQLIKWPWGPPIVKYICNDLRCLMYLTRHLKRDEIDMVHSNVSGCTVGVLISRFWRVPHVWHVREALDLHFNKRICLGMNRLKRLINNADARIPISTAVKDHYEMKVNNTFVINDAVRSEEETIYCPEKDKYFLFASFCLTEAKGASIAIKAFGLSGLYKDGYRLKMVGHCDNLAYKDKLTRIAEEYGCYENIDFVPFQKDIQPLFEHASAFIQASVFEGLGRTTAEAMFFGCPVIATAYSGGTLDLIKDKQTGYLFNGIEECASLMKLVSSTDQTEVILNAQKFAKENLSHNVFGPKLLEVYKSVIVK